MPKNDKEHHAPSIQSEKKRWECSISDCAYTNQPARKLAAKESRKIK